MVTWVEERETMKRHATLFTTTLLTVGMLCAFGQEASASYLDPGSGSYLFQMAIAGIFGALFTLREAITRWRAQRKKAREPEEGL